MHIVYIQMRLAGITSTHNFLLYTNSMLDVVYFLRTVFQNHFSSQKICQKALEYVQPKSSFILIKSDHVG